MNAWEVLNDSFIQNGGKGVHLPYLNTTQVLQYATHSCIIYGFHCNMTTQIHLHMISCKKNPFAYTGTRTHDFASLCQNAGNVSLFVKGEESQKKPQKRSRVEKLFKPPKKFD